MAATVNDSMHSGDTLIAAVPIVDEGGVAVNLAGCAATYRIADGAHGTVRLTKTEGAGIVLAGDTATITLAPADTGTLSGWYYHELEIVDGSGNVSTVFVGVLEIRAEAG